MSITLLAIESSCDDTSAAIIREGNVLSNIMATVAQVKLPFSLKVEEQVFILFT